MTSTSMLVSLCLLASLLSLGLGHTSAKSTGTRYAECQRLKPQGYQLLGCPNGTLYVSQTDPQAPFGTINEALKSLETNDTSTKVILIGPGSYHEVVNITTSQSLHLLGQTSSPSDYKSNTVSLFSSSYINQTTQLPSPLQDNADASTLTISPNRAASLAGAGPLGAPLQAAFKGGEVRIYNIDVANRATVEGVEVRRDTGPSAALVVAYANASFYECRFASYQDTVFIGRNGSAFFSGGNVVGSTDYIYGFGTAYFQRTTLSNRGAGGGIVAWKGSDQWYGPNTFGAYFANVSVLPASDPIPSINLTGACALGRPWNNQSRVVFMDSYLSDIVRPQGFIEWSSADPRIVPNVTHFIESNSTGPGYDAQSRLDARIETVWTPAEKAREAFSVENVFGSQIHGLGWIDEEWLDR